MKLKKKYIWLLGVIVLLVAGIFYLRLSYRVITVSSSAMSPTIKEGSRLLVDMKAYKSKSPELYDMVVCNLAYPVGKYLGVKRVLGFPTDQISYSSDGRLLVNCQQLGPSPKLSILWKEPPLKSITEVIMSSTGVPLDQKNISEVDTNIKISTPYTVPSDSYFMVGDNTDNSNDSRYFGAVPKGDILGKVVYIFPPK